jgi:hypothetical protein
VIEAGLRALLLTHPSVTNLTGTRIRVVKLRESDTFPAIAIACQEQEHINDLDAQGGAVNSTVQIMCMAMTLEAARRVAEEVRMIIAGYTGAAGESDIDACYVDNTNSAFVPLDDGGEQGIHSVDLICLVQHAETVPNN